MHRFRPKNCAFLEISGIFKVIFGPYLHKYLDFNINYTLIHPMISKWILKKETCYHLLQLTRFTSNFTRN